MQFIVGGLFLFAVVGIVLLDRRRTRFYREFCRRKKRSAQ